MKAVTTDSIRRRILEANPKAVSFDVFDTLITRTVGSPRAVFPRVGQRLLDNELIEISCDDFAKLRIRSELNARRNSKTGEVTLEDIYRELLFRIDKNELLNEFCHNEIAVESSCLRPVTAMFELVKSMRAQFKRTLFISDMYLSSNTISAWLREFGFFRDGDQLYVSAEHDCSKGSGKLFEIVLENENLRPNQLVHCGNNDSADYFPARRKGVCAVRFSEANLIQEELPVNRCNSIVAGASRLARLEQRTKNDSEETIVRTATTVTGPLLYYYAKWLMRQAAKKNIKQLWFLARDGYLIYLACKKILNHDSNMDLKLAYVYGSRATYLPLDVTEINEDTWKLLTRYWYRKQPSINRIIQGFSSQESTFVHHLKRIGLAEIDWDAELAPDDEARLKEFAFNDPEFNQDLRNDLLRSKQIFVDYLKQEELFGEHSVGIVDTGWTTRSHSSLIKFLQKSGMNSVELFLFAVIYDKLFLPENHVHSYLFNQAEKVGGRNRNVYYARAIETLLPAKHGRTTKFVREGGRIKPVFGIHENSEFSENLIDVYEQAVMKFLDHMSHEEIVDDSYWNDDIVETILKRFWATPSYDEAVLWGQQLWEEDHLGKSRHRLAHSYGCFDVLLAFYQGDYPKIRVQFWSGAAIKLTPKWMMYIIESSILARKFAAELRRLLLRLKQ